MKLYKLTFGLILVCTSLAAQIVNIPDANFKNALVNTLCVDTDGDGIRDNDADTNDDGEIQLAEAVAVFRLFVNDQNIVDLDGIQNFSNLLSFDCNANDITSFDLSQSPQLEFLSCGYNPLASINISQNSNLKELYVYNTLISTIDLSQNPNLEKFLLRFNSLTSLDVSNNPNLLELDCTNNQITALDLSQNPLLVDLNVYDNLITSLDVSQSPNLIRVICHTNRLTQLNLKNGGNTLITKMMAFDNPNLTCIEVDDETYANSQICNGPSSFGWCKDNTAVYSEDCSLGIDTFFPKSVSLYPNPAKNSLFIASEGIQIETIRLYGSNGMLLKEIESTGGSQTVDVSGLAAGMYFVIISSEGKTVGKKFIKEE